MLSRKHRTAGQGETRAWPLPTLPLAGGAGCLSSNWSAGGVPALGLAGEQPSSSDWPTAGATAVPALPFWRCCVLRARAAGPGWLGVVRLGQNMCKMIFTSKVEGCPLEARRVWLGRPWEAVVVPCAGTGKRGSWLSSWAPRSFQAAACRGPIRS